MQIAVEYRKIIWNAMVWRSSDKFIGLIALISSWVSNSPQTSMFRGHFSQSQCAFWSMWEDIRDWYANLLHRRKQHRNGGNTYYDLAHLHGNMNYGEFTRTRFISTLDIFCFTWNPFSHRHRNDWCWPIYLNKSLRNRLNFFYSISSEFCTIMVVCDDDSRFYSNFRSISSLYSNLLIAWGKELIDVRVSHMKNGQVLVIFSWKVIVWVSFRNHTK